LSEKFSHEKNSFLASPKGGFMNVLQKTAAACVIIAVFAGCRSIVPERPDRQQSFMEAKIYLLYGSQNGNPFSGTLILDRVGREDWDIFRNIHFIEDDTIENWSGKARQVQTTLTATFDQEHREAKATATYTLSELGVEGTFEALSRVNVVESGMLISVSLDPNVRGTILDVLRSVNAAIARARQQADGGNWDSAVDATGLAIGLKLHALYPIPGINVDANGFLLPFYVVYDEFSTVDDKIEKLTIDSNLLWGRDRGVLQQAGPKARHRVQKRLEECLKELSKAISRIRDLSNNLPWFQGDDAPDMLEDLADGLESIKRKLENKQPLGTGRGSDLEQVRALKRNFLVEVSDSLPLWDVYELFRELDKKLERALTLIRTGKVKGRYGLRVKRLLELAERIKRKLESLITGIPADLEPRPLGPPRPTPPVPDYEPGQEDLPPFPPDGFG
jgi:hypothetical protein